MQGRVDQEGRSGGGWGLAGLNLLQASWRGPGPIGNLTGETAGQKGLIFGHFRLDTSGDDGDSSSSSSGNISSSSSSSSSSNCRYCSNRRNSSKERDGSNGGSASRQRRVCH
ncbi:hypothetical protein VYU27_005776 [Nannochloropsis oceanica]